MLLPPEAPVMTLPDAVLFPQAMFPLFIFEPRYRKMLAESLATHRTLVVAMRRPDKIRETPYAIGGLGLIRACVRNKDGTSHVVLQGLARVKLGKATRYNPFRVQTIEPVPTVIKKKARVAKFVATLLELIPTRIKYGLPVPMHPTKGPQADGMVDPKAFSSQQVLRHIRSVQDPCQLADLVSCMFLTTPWQRQVILETDDLEDRLEYLAKFLLIEIQDCSDKLS